MESYWAARMSGASRAWKPTRRRNSASCGKTRRCLRQCVSGAANPGCSRLSGGYRSFYIFLRFSTRPRTICGAGAFACQLVMFYRRRLPRCHPDLTDPTFLFVTLRLAASTPRARLPQPRKGAPLSAGRAFLVLDREVDKAAFGPVWLRDARVASVVADALRDGGGGRDC